MPGSVTGWAFPPRAPRLLHAKCLSKLWEAPRDMWLRGHGNMVCVPVSMPLGKQIRGSDGAEINSDDL